MKRKTVLIILIIVFFVSCSNKSNTETNKKTNNSIDFSSGEYDYQNYWYQNNMVKGNNGYYYMNGYAEYSGDQNLSEFYTESGEKKTCKTIYHVDPEKNIYEPFCYKPDCLHDNADCDSKIYIDEYLTNIYFYDNKIWMTNFDDEYYYLVSIDENTGIRKRECRLGTREEWFDILIIHRGYAYFATIEGLYRKCLYDDSDIECIFNKPAKISVCLKIGAAGDKVFFMYRKGMLLSDNGYTIYSYNINNGELKELCSEAPPSCLQFLLVAETNKLYYYVADKGLTEYDIETDTSKVIYSEMGKYGRIVYGGKKCIFVDNGSSYRFNEKFKSAAEAQEERCIQCFDFEGNLLKTFKPTWLFFIEGGDEKYIFNDNTSLLYMEMSELNEGSDWKNMRLNTQ